MNPELIYVYLGADCNLNCTYCMGKENHKKEAKIPIDPDRVIDYIDQNIGRRRTQIRFFGGEPLLYYREMKYIAGAYAGIENISMDAPTNGKLITAKIVDEVNEVPNFKFVISHDGKNTIKTRGYDILKDNSQLDLLKKLRDISFISVVSGENIEIVSQWDSLSEIFGRQIFSYPVPIMPANDQLPGSLTRLDYSGLSKEMEYICSDYTSLCPKYPQSTELINHLFYKIEQAKRHNCVDQTCFCNKMYGSVHLDLAGNILDCCTSGIKIGDIDTGAPGKLSMSLHHKEKIAALSCKKCDVYMMCRGGCTIVKQSKHDDYCKIMKSMYLPAIKLAKQFNIIE